MIDNKILGSYTYFYIDLVGGASDEVSVLQQ